MEEFNLGDLNNLESVSLNTIGGGDSSSSVHFGSSGVELLMNDKKRSSGGKSFSENIDLTELNDLENELNALSGIGTSSASTSNTQTKTVSSWGNMFGFGGSNNTSSPADVKTIATDSKVGQATIDSIGNNKTWDGFTKMNDIPSTNKTIASSSPMHERERNRKKRMMIKKLEEWYEKGQIKNSSHFNADSTYEEVEDEYEAVMEDKRKENGVRFQRETFVNIIRGVEWANSTFDPFGLQFDGLGETVDEDDGYNEIFEELYEKYKGGKLAPEVSLLLKLGMTASICHFSNSAMSKFAPGMQDVMKQHPDLMKTFTKATADAFKDKSPAFAMANGLINKPKTEQVNTAYGPPPAPVETKGQAPPPRPSMQYTGGDKPNPQRPDISMARGAMFKEQGVDLQNSFVSVDEPYRPSSHPSPSQYQQMSQPLEQQKSKRPEMRGPSTDIDSILAGLKTKTVDIQNDNDSKISMSSIRELENSRMPKQTKRKPRSEKNIVSLSI